MSDFKGYRCICGVWVSSEFSEINHNNAVVIGNTVTYHDYSMNMTLSDVVEFA